MWKIFLQDCILSTVGDAIRKKTLLLLCIVIIHEKPAVDWLTDTTILLQALCFGDFLQNGNFAWACQLADLSQVGSGDIANTQDLNKQSFFFVWCSQSDHHPWEDSAKFGYNQDMIILASFYVFHYLLEPHIEIWQLLLLLFWILVIGNPPKITSFQFIFLMKFLWRSALCDLWVPIVENRTTSVPIYAE
jgi:hypothetical protein